MVRPSHVIAGVVALAFIGTASGAEAAGNIIGRGLNGAVVVLDHIGNSMGGSAEPSTPAPAPGTGNRTGSARPELVGVPTWAARVQ